VIVPNRWTTLESSLAAARAALMVAPGDTARVRAWLANLLKVYGSAAPGGSRTMSGMSFAPETFARYEGPLYSAALTLEYAALSRRVSYEPGRAFAEASLPTFLALDASGGHVQVRAAAGPGPFPPGEGVETGDGRTLYTEAGGEGVFGWSPVATLLAAGARAEAESKAQAKPMAVDSADRLALCRIATQKGSAPGWLSPSASPREQMVRFIGLLAALLAVAALGLVVPRLDLGRRRRRDASDSRQPARDHLSTGMDRQWGRGRFPVQVVPKIGRG